jgi:hypothetical protein
MSFLVAAWDEMRKPRPEPPHMEPLCLGADLVGYSFAYDATRKTVLDDLQRIGRGIPTRRQLAAAIEADRQREAIERAQASQLEAFAG